MIAYPDLKAIGSDRDRDWVNTDVDSCQRRAGLRELRIEDLQGSAGMYRLREELLRRVRAATAPAKVRDVLFKEMLVQ